MAIATLEDYQSGLKQMINYYKVAGPSGQVLVPLSQSIVSLGTPTVITALTNSANGTVPVAGDAGFPSIATWPGAGVLGGVEGQVGAACRLLLYDRLFHAGPYTAGGGVTNLTSQPSYSTRVPGGTDYTGTFMFIEACVATTGAGSAGGTITYTDESNNPGVSTTFAAPAPLSGVDGLCVPISLAAGTTGVRKIESINITAGVGDFNIVVGRPLAWLRFGDTLPRIWPIEERGLVEVFPTSALAILRRCDTTATGIVELNIEIVSN